MNNFEKNVIQIWGDAGRQWLNTLPALVKQFADLWGLYNLQQVNNLTYNYVLMAQRQFDNMPVVLKMGYDRFEIEKEGCALQVYNGNGCIKLLAADLELGAILLDCARPGTSLKSLFPEQDELAAMQLTKVMSKLHVAPIKYFDNLEFAHISSWLQALKSPQAIRKLDGYHLQKAQSLAHDLLQSSGPDVLLHGDLHHDNILLDNNQGWIAIDPKGVLGESIYEIGAFVRNPFPELLRLPNAQLIMERRIRLFAELLQVDYQRVQAWSYVQAVLADCWAAEVSDDGALWLAEAAMIDKM